MDFVVDNIHIHVEKKGERRLIFANGDARANPMMWNKRGYRWDFSTGDVAEQLKEYEMEISNSIIMLERTKPL